MKARASSAGVMGSARPPAPRPVSPGQPENGLPRWHHLPLDAKIPLPRVVPKGKAVMYPAKAGEPLWRTPSESLGFDLNDPLLMQLPGPHEFNPLHDPFSSGHLRRPDLQDALYCHGLVTRHGFCLSSLKNFNRFREYLHSVNLRQLKRIKNEVEGQLRTEYEHLALDVVREERQKEEELESDTAAEGGTVLTARYSDIMRDEESKLPDQLPDFFSLLPDKEKQELSEQNKTFATIRFAKIQNRESRLAAVKAWLRKDGRKGALLRLRRLQIMEERRKKGINNWKTRTAVQSEFFEELKMREIGETEVRRVHLAEKQQYQSAIGSVHDVKYNEIVRKWRENRLRSVARLFCGYLEDFQTTFIAPESTNEGEMADAEIQTDPKDDVDPQLDTILLDRSTDFAGDITDGFNADEVRDYENAARQLVESALFVHDEVLLPATSRYKAELDKGGQDVAIQTSDSLQQMLPFDGPKGARQGSTKDVQLQDEPNYQKIGPPVNGVGFVEPGRQKESAGDDRNRSHSRVGTSCKPEVVFTTVENEVLRAEKGDEQPNDKVELLAAAIDALEKLADGSEDSLDVDARKVEQLLVRGREVLAEAINIRRNSSMIVEEIVRLAIVDIEQQLEEITNDKQSKEAERWKAGSQSARHRGQRRRKGRQSAIKKVSFCPGKDLMTYIVGRAVAIANQAAKAQLRHQFGGQSVDKPEVEEDGDDFTQVFLKRIGDEEAITDRRRRWSALLSACDDFNDALCDRYAQLDLSEREFVQLVRDSTMNKANRLVTASIKKVMEDLEGEGLDTSHPELSVEATRAVAEAMLNLALHRDLEAITKDCKKPCQIIDLVARIVKTHGLIRYSASFASIPAVGNNPLWTRWHLASILLNRLIVAALDRAMAEQGACELTTETLISLAAAVDLRGLASNVVLHLPKKGRMRRRCPRQQPPGIDQTKFRSAIIDSFSDKMKHLVDWAMLPDACVNSALSEAVRRATSTSSPATSPKRLSQQATALFADVKSIVADSARVVLRRTVGNLAAKFRATNDSEVESMLDQIETALMDIDAYGLLSTESQLGLRAKNSIELSRERLKEIRPSTHHWSVTEHTASDQEVSERVTRKMSVSNKVVRLSLTPTETDLIHVPHLPHPESIDQGPEPEAATAAADVTTKLQPSTATDDFLPDLSVIPMFGSVALDIDPNLVTEDLHVLSIKHDEDLNSPDLSMRNSFRNIHRPDVSSLRRFSSSSSTVSGPGSIHDRVKDVFMKRRSTIEDESQIRAQSRIPTMDDDSEFVISQAIIPGTDSVPEFWPMEPEQSANDAPIHSTVTTEYSKQYNFPEDVEPVKRSDHQTLKPEKSSDHQTLKTEKRSDHQTLKPEKSSDHQTLKTEKRSDHQTLKPEKSSDQQTLKPQKRSNHQTLKPEKRSDHQTLKPEKSSDQQTLKPEKRSDHQTLKPEKRSDHQTLTPEKPPDEISLASYLYGDPEEFHHLKISSSVIDDEDSQNLLAEGRAIVTPKKQDPAVSSSHTAEREGKPIRAEESEEVVIATRDLHNGALERCSALEHPKKRISDVDEEQPIPPEDVALNLGAVAAALLKKGASSTSSMQRMGNSNASVALPPVPRNSKESSIAVQTKTTAATKPMGIAESLGGKQKDDEGDFGQGNK